MSIYDLATAINGQSFHNGIPTAFFDIRNLTQSTVDGRVSFEGDGSVRGNSFEPPLPGYVEPSGKIIADVSTDTTGTFTADGVHYQILGILNGFGAGSNLIFQQLGPDGTPGQTLLFGPALYLRDPSYVSGHFSTEDTFIKPPTYVPCFAQGTLIETASGPRPVETIAVGDDVVTAGGQLRRVIWVGSQRFHCASHRRPDMVHPVVIDAGALAPGIPDRPLLLSPGHAVAMAWEDGDVLVPAGALVNGATVRQQPVASITYWHVELEQHDLLLAHGVAAESYLDVGNRWAFGEVSGIALVEPSAGDDGGCLPRVLEGPVVCALAGRVRRRAEDLGWSLVPTSSDVALLADGRPVPGVVVAGTARFLLTGQPARLRITSRNGRACFTDPGNQDPRWLGLMVRSVVLENAGFGRREVPLGAPELGQGWHDDEGSHRWTDGSAELAAGLLNDAVGPTYVEIGFAPLGFSQWRHREGSPAEEVRLAVA